MTIKAKALIFTAAAVAMAAGFGFSNWQKNNQENGAESEKQDALAEARKNFSPIQGVILNPARKIIIPALIKDDNETFTQDDVKGQWHFIFFGYTHCPDICPVTMGVVAQAKKVATNNQQMFPGVIFVSVDPDRDTAEMLAEYVDYFDEDFIGVTGDKPLIKALSLQMSVVYMQMPPTSEASKTLSSDNNKDSYVIDHSSSLLLINPEGKLAAFFNPPHDVQTIINDFQTVLNKRLPL